MPAPLIPVLIVEDSATLRMTMSLLLSQLGYQTDCAANGIEAIRRIKNWQYKLIFMDVQMPGMDGLETTSAIRAYEHNHALESTPIIAVTSDSDRDSCLSCGMNDFMQKPVSSEQLQVVLNKWLPALTPYTVRQSSRP